MSNFQPAPSAVPALAEARRRRWLWFVAILAILLSGAFALRPAYRWGKAWRARALAAEAERFILAAEWQQASEKVQAALQLSRSEPAVIRAAARLYTRAGAAQAHDYWKAVVAFPSVTAEERREAAQFGLAAHRYDLAQEQLAILLKAEPAHLEDLDLAGQLAWQQNDPAGALRLTDQLLALDHAHPGARLRRGRLLLAARDPESREQGMEELVALGKSDASTSLAALETLATSPSLPPSQSSAIAAALATHPAGKTEHRLAAVTIQMRLTPENRAELFERAFRDFRSGGPEAVVALARWAMQQGETARVLDLIPLPLSLTRQDLFLVRVDALATQKEWAEIERILSHEKAPVPPFHRQIFLARAALELGLALAAESHWSKALEEAARNPAHLLYLAQYSEKIGARPIAEKAWQQLARNPSWALRANAALVPLLEADGNTRGLREIMRQLVRLVPQDPAPRNDAAYLDLLVGENLNAAFKTAHELVREYPDRLAYRTTLALAYLRTGQPHEASGVYANLEVPWDKTTSSTRAVRAAVLAANGARTEASAMIQSLSTQGLKSEEEELIASLR